MPFKLQSAPYFKAGRWSNEHPDPALRGKICFTRHDAIYAEWCEGDEKEERVFLIDTDAEKLFFFEMMMDGQLDHILQYKNGESGVYYKTVDAPLHMDTQKVAEDLAAVVPAEIAGLIVDHAVD